MLSVKVMRWLFLSFGASAGLGANFHLDPVNQNGTKAIF